MRLASLRSVVLIFVLVLSFFSFDALGQCNLNGLEFVPEAGSLTSGDQIVCSGGSPQIIVGTAITDPDGSGGISRLYRWQSLVSPFTEWTTLVETAGSRDYNLLTSITQETRFRRITVYSFDGLTCESEPTNIITVTVRNDFFPSTVAADQTICGGTSPITLTSTEATDNAGGTITYRWEQASSPFTAFAIFNPPATELTYVPPTLTASRSYRIRATSDFDGATCASQPLLITVLAPGAGNINSNNPTLTVCEGSSTNINGSNVNPPTLPEGIERTYKWETASAEAGPWSLIPGASLNTYSPVGGWTLSASAYYRRITVFSANGVTCESVPTNTAFVSVNEVKGGTISGDQVICSGGNPTILSNVSAGTPVGVTYQWQRSANQTTWNNIGLETATAASYDPEPGTTQEPNIIDTRYYRRVATFAYPEGSCLAYSNVITVSVNSISISITGIPTATSANIYDVCPGGRVRFEATVTTSGTPSYQWQKASASGGPYSDIEGATSLVYLTDEITATNSYFRINVTSTIPGLSCTSPSTAQRVRSNQLPLNPFVTSSDGLWGDAGTWGSGVVPGATSGTLCCPVQVGNTVTLDQDISITNGVYYFGYKGIKTTSTNVLDDEGSPYYRLSMNRAGNDATRTTSILRVMSGTTYVEGDAYLNNTNLFIAKGATLVIGPRSCTGTNPANCEEPSEQCLADLAAMQKTIKIGPTTYSYTLLIDNQTEIIVEGTLIVYGNVINRNNGAGMFKINEGNVYISGNYLSDTGAVGVTEDSDDPEILLFNGDIKTCGTMITRGSSAVYGTTNECLNGPCSGKELASCVKFSIAFESNPQGSSLLQQFCDINPSEKPSNIVITSNNFTNDYNYEFIWVASPLSAGNGFEEIDFGSSSIYESLSDNALGFKVPLEETVWHRLQVIRTKEGEPTCNGFSQPAQVIVGNWLGLDNSNWDLGENWQFKNGSGVCVTGTVPGSGSNVIISRGVNFMPEITGAGSRDVGNIRMNPGTSLTLNNTANLNLWSLMNIANREDVEGIVSVNINAADITDGTGTLTVKSTSTSTQGRIGPLPDEEVIKGQITVERFIPGTSTRVNRYISMPVSNVKIPSITNLQAWFGTKLTHYDETVEGHWDNGWKYLPSNYALELIPGKGYLAYQRGTIMSPFQPLTFKGPLDVSQNRGTVEVYLSHTQTTCPPDDSDCLATRAADGWHLVGNPYPSPIIWRPNGTIESDAVVVDMYNGGAYGNGPANYKTVTTGGSIAMGQAFWIRALSNTSITFLETDKNIVDNVQFFRERSVNPALEVIVSNDSLEDRSTLFMDESATSAYDLGFDASKFPGIPLRVSLVSDDKHSLARYVTNTISDQDIPLLINTPGAGQYSLVVNKLLDQNELEGVVLKDALTQTVHPLGSRVNFKVTENSLSVKNRFYLSKNSNIEQNQEIKLSLYPNPVVETLTIEVSTLNDVEVEVLNINGQVVGDQIIPAEFGLAKGVISMKDLPSGIYLLKSKVNGRLYTTKIVKR
jgi:hypothetical protein